MPYARKGEINKIDLFQPCDVKHATDRHYVCRGMV